MSTVIHVGGGLYTCDTKHTAKATMGGGLLSWQCLTSTSTWKVIKNKRCLCPPEAFPQVPKHDLRRMMGDELGELDKEKHGQRTTYVRRTFALGDLSEATKHFDIERAQKKRLRLSVTFLPAPKIPSHMIHGKRTW
ncbi:hypothetical protein PMIN04_003213 [Paraphaeosphaeria minitans]